MTMVESMGSHRLRDLVDPWSYHLWYGHLPFNLSAGAEQIIWHGGFDSIFNLVEPFTWDIEDIAEAETYRKAKAGLL